MCGGRNEDVLPEEITPEMRDDLNSDMVPNDLANYLPLPNHNRCRTCDTPTSYDILVTFKGRCKSCSLGPPESREPYVPKPKVKPPVTHILGGPQWPVRAKDGGPR